MVGQIGFGWQSVASSRTMLTKNAPITTKKLLAVGGVALGLGGLGLFGTVATAAATPGGLAATPMPPVVIDDDGFHNDKASSYPADPMWPVSQSWLGKSSNACCSR